MPPWRGARQCSFDLVIRALHSIPNMSRSVYRDLRVILTATALQYARVGHPQQAGR